MIAKLTIPKKLKRQKEEAKANEETAVVEEQQDVPVPVVTLVNNILH